MISCQDHGTPQGHQRRRAPATTVEWGHRQPANGEGRKSASVWVRRRRQSFKSWSRRITVSVSLRCFPTFSKLFPIPKPTLWCAVVEDSLPTKLKRWWGAARPRFGGPKHCFISPICKGSLCTGSGLNHRVLGTGTSKPGDCHQNANCLIERCSFRWRESRAG